ncbi:MULTISPECIES: ATP-binding protein [unclassified Streptomyces]|uniref:ATP-binding protein n=1 Tax=unclassified Streptomyces TaxID=2593676 RepID=UPI003329C4DD
MARRPLPRILTSGSTSLARGRDLARTAADNATDVLHPLLVIGRGLRVLAAAGRRKWAATPKDKRGPALFLGAACVLVVALVPYGPLTALLALMAAAGWHGRDRTPVKTGPSDAETDRLRSLYEALVPYFSAPEDPAPLFSHGGAFDDAFSDYAFDAAGRVSRLRIRYPAYFTDGEPASRARIEALLHAKSGRGREYLFDWDEEANRLEMSVLEALPTGIAAQPFVTSPGEYVLGFTDPSGVQRTLPVLEGEEPRDLPPVIWRTGPASSEPHLLAVGQPGAGTTTLLRSIALQALRQGGDVMIVEGGGSNEYACLAGRAGVLAVECGPTGALATVEWAAHETERRLIAAHRAREAGRPAPEDTRRPLWILLDRPSVLAHLATAEGRPDPLAQLQVPLRHGRAAHVTVVVAEHCDHLELIGDAVWQHTRARVFLGPAPVQQLTDVLGLPPHTTPAPQLPPGRGYARLGTGPVHRLQVPATPDPYDDATHPAHRHAVLELLPERQKAADGPGGGEAAPAPTGPLKDQPPAQGGAVGAEELPEVPAEAP